VSAGNWYQQLNKRKKTKQKQVIIQVPVPRRYTWSLQKLNINPKNLMWFFPIPVEQVKSDFSGPEWEK
jgi:hypothetical protein